MQSRVGAIPRLPNFIYKILLAYSLIDLPPRYPSNMVKTPPKIDEDTHQSERDSPSNDPRNDEYKI